MASHFYNDEEQKITWRRTGRQKIEIECFNESTHETTYVWAEYDLGISIDSIRRALWRKSLGLEE